MVFFFNPVLCRRRYLQQWADVARSVIIITLMIIFADFARIITGRERGRSFGATTPFPKRR